jgi:hypothetical protein
MGASRATPVSVDLVHVLALFKGDVASGHSQQPTGKRVRQRPAAPPDPQVGVVW